MKNHSVANDMKIEKERGNNTLNNLMKDQHDVIFSRNILLSKIVPDSELRWNQREENLCTHLAYLQIYNHGI